MKFIYQAKNKEGQLRKGFVVAATEAKAEQLLADNGFVIISMKVQKYAYRRQHGRLLTSPSGWAGYYVPVSAIAAFLPKDFRY